MPSHWLPLFLQLEQPPGNDEEGFTGLRGDKLVGEAEAVTVVPPEPVGSMPPSPVSPETTTHWQPEERITSSNASVSRRTAPSKALRSSGSGWLNRIFDTHKVMQSSKTVGVPAVLRNSARAVPMCSPSWSGHSSVRQFSGRRARCRRMRSVIRRIVRPCFSCSDIQHRTVRPVENPGLRTCAFAAPRAAEIESQIQAYP